MMMAGRKKVALCALFLRNGDNRVRIILPNDYRHKLIHISQITSLEKDCNDSKTHSLFE